MTERMADPTENDPSGAEGPRSCVYVGEVMHHRLRPMDHKFVYRTFTFFVDLDEIPAMTDRMRLFSHEKAGVFSWRAADHGPRDGSPIKPWVEGHLRRGGFEPKGWRIFALCLPRMLGYVFNPLTTYYCYDPAGRLAAMLYEVKNTFGDQHGYLVPVEAGQNGPLTHACDKGFHVSPFIAMHARYHFKLRRPGEKMSLVIRETLDNEDLLVASQTGHRKPLNDATLARLLVSHPLMTLKIIAGIHWEALHLWRKGAKYIPRATPPVRDVTIVTGNSGSTMEAT